MPDESVVTVAGLVVTALPSYVIVMVDEAAKPEPDAVTVVPAGPDVGVIDRDGELANAES